MRLGIHFRLDPRHFRRLILAVVILLLLAWLRSASAIGGQQRPTTPLRAAPATSQSHAGPSKLNQETNEPLYRPPLECAGLFETETIEYTGRGYSNEKFSYALSVPIVKKDTRYPLIVWLHGYKEGGQSDNPFACLRIVDKHVLFPPWNRSDFPFFVLTLQCPANNRYWMTNDPNLDDMVNVMAAVTDKVLADYNRAIDRNRIYLAGVSSGGDGCWELAQRRSDLFAAVVPMASGGSDLQHVNQLLEIPIWSFHTTKDVITSPLKVQQTVSTLQEAGGIVHLTLVESESHDCWTAAFTRYDLLNWLFAQQKGDGQELLPGSLSWAGHLRSLRHRVTNAFSSSVKFIKSYSPAELVGQIGIPLIIGFLAYRIFRPRKGRKQTVVESQ